MHRLLLLFIFCYTTAFADEQSHSLWIEPNYVDTQYSVLFDLVEATQYSFSEPFMEYVPWGMKVYRVVGTVNEVYKGEFSKGEQLELRVHLSWADDIANYEKQFLLSFCQSSKGIYFNGTEFQMQLARKGNINKFRDIAANGTEYEGEGDCIINDAELHPDNQQLKP